MNTLLQSNEFRNSGNNQLSDKRTIHLVYPADEKKKSSPWTIGSNLKKRLGTQFEVVLHDWDSNYAITPDETAILLGHPHPRKNTVFRKSFEGPWSHRFVICPFTTNPQQMYFVEPYVREADAFFAICGPTWAAKIETSDYSHLKDKFIPIDMGIDPLDWPPLDREFSPPHHRRFAYIGSSLALKGTPFLEKIAAQRPSDEFAWIGGSDWVRTHATRIPFTDLNTSEGRKKLSEFDFIFSPGKSDANPTVLLEAMCLGLIPVCTAESGYDNHEHFYVMNYGEVSEASKLIDVLQSTPGEDLVSRREINYQAIRNYSWEKFTTSILTKILESINQGELPKVSMRPKGFALRQFYMSVMSPYRYWRSTRAIKLFENRLYYRLAVKAKRAEHG